MWLSTWHDVGRIVLFAFAGYLAVLTLVRLLGKRTMSKMNPSDFVITVAIGSTLATFILDRSVALVQGFAALAALLLLQWATEFTSTRSKRFRQIVEGQPTLLVYRGHFLSDIMRREQINEYEIREALRQNGLTKLTEAEAVVLEIDGTFSVIPRGGADRASQSDDNDAED